MSHRYPSPVFLLFAVLAVLLWTPLLFAQGTGEISGTVRDDQQGVIPGVTVTLRNVETGVTRVDLTTEEGRYIFRALPPGHYEMTAELAGFQTVRITGDLVIRIGFEMTRDIVMPIGSVAETVTVTGESPLVEVRSTEVGGVVSQSQINDLPINSRNYLSLALLMPGTTIDGTRSFFPTVNVGGAVTFNATGNILDGTINNWVEDGEPRQNLPEDAVLEFKVSNAQFDAEYGLATAGLVQVVTKSGTNAYHGTGFWYFRDKALNAKGVFEEEKPEYRRDQFGGSIGGPIVEDKMHFFFAAERTDVTEFYTVNTGLPQFYGVHEGTFEQPFFRNLYVGRFDWQVDQQNTLFARYAQEDETSTCGGCGGTVATEAGYDQETPRKSIVVGHTWLPGPDRLNDFRFQGAWNGYYIAPTGTEIWKDPGSFPPERINRLRQTFYFPSLTWGSSFDEVGPESRYEFRDTYTMNLAKHTIKLGGNYSYNKYFEENTGDVLGSWTFGTDQYFDPDDAASLANLTDPVLFSASLPPINTKKPTQYVAFFVQDDWQLRENLVLNLGLRWERLINCCNEELDPSIFPVEVPLIDVSERGDKNNFGPRLGLVWDIEGEGTSVLRWGYGVYYGHVRTLGVLDEFRNFQQYSLEITNPSYPDPYQGRDPVEFIVSGPTNLTIVDNGYVQPYSQQYTLGFSRQLSPDFAIHLDGVYNFTLRDRKIRDDESARSRHRRPALSRVRPFRLLPVHRQRPVQGFVRQGGEAVPRSKSVPRLLHPGQERRQLAALQDIRSLQSLGRLGSLEQRSPPQSRRERLFPSSRGRQHRCRLPVSFRASLECGRGPRPERRRLQLHDRRHRRRRSGTRHDAELGKPRSELCGGEQLSGAQRPSSGERERHRQFPLELSRCADQQAIRASRRGEVRSDGPDIQPSEHR